MENYDRDDAFFTTVNNHRKMVDLDVATKSKIEHNFHYIERAVENSIKMNEAEVKYAREVEKSKERFKKLVSTLLVASALLVPTAVLAGNAVIDGMKIDTAKEVCYNEVKRDLVSGRCAHYDVTTLDDGSKSYKFTLDDNDIAEYSFVGDDTIDYIYNMKSLLSEKEFDKFIKSRSFINPETNTKEYYVNFTHFLSVNGFRNEREFNRKVEKSLLNRYENGEFRIDYNAVYLDDLPSFGRGGK